MRTLLSSEKAGYFKASRVFGATSGVNQVSSNCVRKHRLAVSAPVVELYALTNGARSQYPLMGGKNFRRKRFKVYAAYIDQQVPTLLKLFPFLANDRTSCYLIVLWDACSR
jgi:hypothetical protein